MKASPPAVQVDRRIEPVSEQHEDPRSPRVDPQAAARETGMPKGARRERRPPSSTVRPAPPPAESERSATGEGRGHGLTVQQQARLQPFRAQPPEARSRTEEPGKAPQDATGRASRGVRRALSADGTHRADLAERREEAG